jgi:hypothetical protein
VPPEDVEVEAGAGAGAKRPLVQRWLRSFGAFWWGFLVGDTPELFVGALVAIGVVALLVKASSLNAVAVGGFPVLVVLLLAVSVGRERRAKRR